MQRTSAPNIAGAPLPQQARGFWKAYGSGTFEWLERLLEAERAQLPPWFVVGFGTGITAWFALGQPRQWAAEDRRLPRGCKPRWLKLDRVGLAKSGGVSIDLGADPRVQTVAERIGEHPWAM